jgi:hypothetical protein
MKYYDVAPWLPADVATMLAANVRALVLCRAVPCA